LPFYKANYIGLKTRDRHARQDTPCSRWRCGERVKVRVTFPVIARSARALRGDLAFLSLKKLKSKLDRVKNLGLPRHTELRGSQWHLVCHSWMVLSGI